MGRPLVPGPPFAIGAPAGKWVMIIVLVFADRGLPILVLPHQLKRVDTHDLDERLKKPGKALKIRYTIQCMRRLLITVTIFFCFQRYHYRSECVNVYSLNIQWLPHVHQRYTLIAYKSHLLLFSCHGYNIPGVSCRIQD